MFKWMSHSRPSPSPGDGRSCASSGRASSPATEIAARFHDVTRPAVSQHLKVLREAKLIDERREGTRRLYRVNQVEMAKLRDFLDEYWASGLDRLREVAETAEQEKQRRTPKKGRQ